MIFRISNYILDVDVEKTHDYYNAAEYTGDSCSCIGCRNYAKAADFLPQEVVSFFSKLGVDIKKVREVFVNNVNADNTVYYGGFTHICGKLISGESAYVPIGANTSRWEEEKAYFITDDFHVSFNDDCSLLDDNFPLPAIQLEFLADIPWVLEEANDDYPKDMKRRN